MKDRVLAVIQETRARGIKLILANALPYAWSLPVDDARKDYNLWLEGQVGVEGHAEVADYDILLSDGESPAALKAEYTYDDLHPNIDGQKLLATAIIL